VRKQVDTIKEEMERKKKSGFVKGTKKPQEG
jgi:hypothetical protein